MGSGQLICVPSTQPHPNLDIMNRDFLKSHGRGIGATGDYVFLFPVFFLGVRLLCVFGCSLCPCGWWWPINSMDSQWKCYTIFTISPFWEAVTSKCVSNWRLWCERLNNCNGQDLLMSWTDMSKNNAFVVISHWDFIQPQCNLNILTNTDKVYLDLPFHFIFHPRGWL